jgi:hypothetical protein
MNALQIVRRFNQQNKEWSNSFDIQRHQFALIEKLFTRNGLKIEMTCSACPEQYDVFKDGRQVGYFRLRHGEFRVDYPECMEETIFEAQPNGDGIFHNDERLNYMAKAMRALLEKLESCRKD